MMSATAAISSQQQQSSPQVDEGQRFLGINVIEELTPSPEIPTEKKEEIIDGALLKNLMNGQSNGEKPVKTDITHIPDNEFDELD